MMIRAFRHARPRMAMVLLLIFGFGAVVMPAHAAEEALHHALEHHSSDALQINNDGGDQDERSVHPEHAAHCHGGNCGMQLFSRNDLPVPIFSAEPNKPVAHSFALSEYLLQGLFRPPRS